MILFPEGRPSKRETFQEYCASGGYEPVRKDILSEVTASGLRGRGGAGFPVGKKWSIAAQTESDTRYLVCNAGEDEPGSFKDRILLERDTSFNILPAETILVNQFSAPGDGKLIALSHDVVSAWPTARWGIPDFLSPSVDKKGPLDAFTVNGSDFFYTVPNHHVRAIKNEMAHNATPSGQLRSVAPGWTFWAVESMIDEIAHAAGKDPAEFRIGLLDGKGKNDGGAQRLRNTLLAAMGLAGYGTKKLPKGEGMGVACVSSQERATASWTACVAHVAVSPSGEVKVKKLTLKPMTTDEAILEMELLGHDFFVFASIDTELINVLYRRRDGDFGLIEPRV